MAAARLREYHYRKVMGLTHEQYLDESSETIEWMLRIDDLWRDAEARRDGGHK